MSIDFSVARPSLVFYFLFNLTLPIFLRYTRGIDGDDFTYLFSSLRGSMPVIQLIINFVLHGNTVIYCFHVPSARPFR